MIFYQKIATQKWKNSTIHDVILEISQKRLGATAVIRNDKLLGIITDGDLRRMLEKENLFQFVCKGYYEFKSNKNGS